MYAVIEVGAKQYNVEKDDIIAVDRQEIAQGDNISIDKVLLISGKDKIQIGQPYIKGAKVEAVALKQSSGQKVVSFKYRRRKNSHWTKGHRAKVTELKIKAIVAGS